MRGKNKKRVIPIKSQEKANNTNCRAHIQPIVIYTIWEYITEGCHELTINGCPQERQEGMYYTLGYSLPSTQESESPDYHCRF